MVFYAMRNALNSALRNDWLLLIVPGVIWGASFLFIAEGLDAIGPSGVAFVRILIGFATLACFPAARRSIAGDRLSIFLLGVFWMAFPLSMFPFAEQSVSSAVTGMLNGANPLFAGLVASVIARQLPPRNVLMGIAVGMAGAVLIAWPSVNAGGNSAFGILLILAALFSYGLAINIARPLQLRHGALPVIWRAQAVALVLTAPLGLPDLMNAHWTLAPLLSLLALGALGTGLAFVLAAIAAGRVGATRASSIAFLIPPVALGLGVIVRGERVALVAAAGCAVCLAGAWLMRRQPGVKAAQPTTIPQETHESTNQLRTIRARAV
jgi:drug/metabolite transporter (DMT)-like permease